MISVHVISVDLNGMYMAFCFNSTFSIIKLQRNNENTGIKRPGMAHLSEQFH